MNSNAYAKLLTAALGQLYCPLIQASQKSPEASVRGKETLGIRSNLSQRGVIKQ